MVEIITCPKCKRQLNVPEQYLGETVQCPRCQHLFVAAPIRAPSVPVAKTPEAAQPRPDDEDDEPDVRTALDRHRGKLILTLGLIALVGGLVFFVPIVVGPVAWAMGSWDLRAIRDGHMDPRGESKTRTGQMLGMMATMLLILGLLFGGLAIMDDLDL